MIMQFGLTIVIKLQSFGDVITNSSSEVFCCIYSDRLNEIVEILNPCMKKVIVMMIQHLV